jgi:hypothetical protein
VNVTVGFLGWGNPGCNTLSSLDCYGPGGRWGKSEPFQDNPRMGGRSGQCGDLLPDALARVGESEGATLIVVSVSRREQMADKALIARIESAVRAAVSLPVEEQPELLGLVHEHWSGSDRGDCPQCEALYGPVEESQQ